MKRYWLTKVILKQFNKKLPKFDVIWLFLHAATQRIQLFTWLPYWHRRGMLASESSKAGSTLPSCSRFHHFIISQWTCSCYGQHSSLCLITLKETSMGKNILLIELVFELHWCMIVFCLCFGPGMLDVPTSWYTYWFLEFCTIYQDTIDLVCKNTKFQTLTKLRALQTSV